MNFSDYHLKENEVSLLEPCFRIVLFSSVKITADFAPKNVLAPYQVFLTDFRDQIKWIHYDFAQKGGRAVTDKNIYSPIEWLTDPTRRSRDNAYLKLYGGKSNVFKDRLLPSLDWMYTKGAMTQDSRDIASHHYSLSFTLDWLEQHGVESIERYLHRLLSDYPLSSGYAGYALDYDDGEVLTRYDLQGYLHHWLQRHPGIMSTSPLAEGWAAAKEDAVIAIGWITLLGEEFCSQMGGVSGLQSKLAHLPGVVITSLPNNGALIRIGARPQLGDVQSNESLDIYREVGRVFSPVRCHNFIQDDNNYIDVLGIDDRKEREQWLSRFFVGN